MGDHIKQENDVDAPAILPEENNRSRDIISLSDSSDSESFCFSSDDDDESDAGSNPKKKQKIYAPLPVGFLDPIVTPQIVAPIRSVSIVNRNNVTVGVKDEEIIDDNIHERRFQKEISTAETGNEKALTVVMQKSCRQFWKAGDYEGSCENGVSVADMDHVRVHPKFLHSNATSHKWALGAFAELLDNALDEVCYGATYVHVDVLDNMKEQTKMVLVEDNGGGMNPDKMRQCMSLGYSVKSKMANTIGQYGNGFKTSTMRLGGDVIVFSRCKGNNGASITQSIGMLSYTFLRNTGKEDIVVPMIDYVKKGENWNKLVKSSPECWQRNLETIVDWSPYESEEHLLQQLDLLKDQGTRVVIYNLWEDDEGSLELDFDIDQHDIQIRGAMRDEKKIDMAANYPSCKHFLTYQHSLRSYASILYRRIPPGFRIILRGEDVDHHDIVDDMMYAQDLVYKPVISPGAKVAQKDMVAKVTLGFVKDAEHHIDVQGFSVYHKNRLIKPFWRVWNAAGSDGRGVIGVLEANFVEPAHDKQGFERTTVLSRLENRLIHLQKTYWSSNCQLIGYAQRRNLKKKSTSPGNEPSSTQKSNANNELRSPQPVRSQPSNEQARNHNSEHRSQPSNAQARNHISEHRSQPSNAQARNHISEHRSQPSNAQARNHNSVYRSSQPGVVQNQNNPSPSGVVVKPISAQPLFQPAPNVQIKTEENNVDRSIRFPSNTRMKEENDSLKKENYSLKQDNHKLQTRLKYYQNELQYEKDRCKYQLEEIKQKMEKMDQEQEMFVSSFSEERVRRQQEEEHLRSKLREASETIQALLSKVKRLEMS